LTKLFILDLSHTEFYPKLSN